MKTKNKRHLVYQDGYNKGFSDAKKIIKEKKIEAECSMIKNVVLVGRLTKDSDLKYTSSGTAVATFTLAVNRNFTNGNGNREADFINCVTGRLQSRRYENQSGQKVYVTEVICENFQLLESKPKTGDQQGTSTGSNKPATSDPATYKHPDPFENGTPVDISDDDLPF